jgi:hypothetical protein
MTDDAAPERPILALTLALAGKREVAAADRPGLEDALRLAFHTLGARLATLDIDRVLGAVLPVSRADFLAHGPVADVAGFEAAAADCAFIVEMDGVPPPAPGAPLPDEGPAPRHARRERGEAFGAQSELILRMADILIAVDDAADAGRVGGTRQTIRAALDLAVPVVLPRLGHDGVAILRSRADFDEPTFLSETAAQDALWRLAGDLIGVGAAAEAADYARDLLSEFYGAAAPRPGLLGRLWDAFEAPFKHPGQLPRDIPAAPCRPYRDRASALSAYYSGLYRGSFLVGYALAVGAVVLAGSALVLLVVGRPLGAPEALMAWLLAILGLTKLGVVVAIARLAKRANHDRLAHRAADYRYLSERLRAMTFLPREARSGDPGPSAQPGRDRHRLRRCRDLVRGGPAPAAGAPGPGPGPVRGPGADRAGGDPAGGGGQPERRALPVGMRPPRRPLRSHCRPPAPARGKIRSGQASPPPPAGRPAPGRGYRPLYRRRGRRMVGPLWQGLRGDVGGPA